MTNLAYRKLSLKLNNSVLVQNNSPSICSDLILNSLCMNMPCNPSNNFTLKNYLFGTVKVMRNAIKSKFISNGWGIASDGADSWSFGNDFPRNVAIFGAACNSLSH